MNRRNSIKSILGIGLISVSSFSIYKWKSLNRPQSLQSILIFKPTIAELAETLIPETDTPGALRSGVDVYIINIFTNCTSTADQNRFLNGLSDFENYTKDKFDKSFINCSLEEKASVVSYFEKKGSYSYEILNKINRKFLGGSFFYKFKALAIEGYCNSELGATKGLAYDYIPGRYESCILLEANQKSWATK